MEKQPSARQDNISETLGGGNSSTVTPTMSRSLANAGGTGTTMDWPSRAGIPKLLHAASTSKPSSQEVALTASTRFPVQTAVPGDVPSRKTRKPPHPGSSSRAFGTESSKSQANRSLASKLCAQGSLELAPENYTQRYDQEGHVGRGGSPASVGLPSGPRNAHGTNAVSASGSSSPHRCSPTSASIDAKSTSHLTHGRGRGHGDAAPGNRPRTLWTERATDHRVTTSLLPLPPAGDGFRNGRSLSRGSRTSSVASGQNHENMDLQRGNDGDADGINSSNQRAPHVAVPNSNDPLQPQPRESRSTLAPQQPSTPAAESSTPVVGWQAPSKLGGYRIGKPLGEGGFGTVYQASGADGLQVALKFLASDRGAFDTTEDAHRASTEAQILSCVQHEHIVELLEVVVTQVNAQPGKLARRGAMQAGKPQQKGLQPNNATNTADPATLGSNASSTSMHGDQFSCDSGVLCDVLDNGRGSRGSQRCSVLVLQYAAGGNLKHEIQRKGALNKAHAKSIALAAIPKDENQPADSMRENGTTGPRVTAVLRHSQSVGSAGSSSASGTHQPPGVAQIRMVGSEKALEAVRTGLYGAYEESEAGLIAHQMSSALALLHSKCIAHLDVKPDNVLLSAASRSRGSRSAASTPRSTRRPFGLHCLLTDFGLARYFAAGQKLKIDAGSLPYLPPEVLRGVAAHPASVDMWSLGVTLYACLLGKLPFRPDSHPHLYDHLDAAGGASGRSRVRSDSSGGRATSRSSFGLRRDRGNETNGAQQTRRRGTGRQSPSSPLVSPANASPHHPNLQPLDDGIGHLRARSRSNSPESAQRQLGATAAAVVGRPSFRPRANTDLKGSPTIRTEKTPVASARGRPGPVSKLARLGPSTVETRQIGSARDGAIRRSRSFGNSQLQRGRSKSKSGAGEHRHVRQQRRKRTTSSERIRTLLKEIAPSDAEESEMSGDSDSDSNADSHRQEGGIAGEGRSDGADDRGRGRGRMIPLREHLDTRDGVSQSTVATAELSRPQPPVLPKSKPRTAAGITRDAIVYGTPIFPSFLSPEATSLLRSLLHKDPAMRPSASSVKRHTPWVPNSTGHGVGLRPPWITAGLDSTVPSDRCSHDGRTSADIPRSPSLSRASYGVPAAEPGLGMGIARHPGQESSGRLEGLLVPEAALGEVLTASPTSVRQGISFDSGSPRVTVPRLHSPDSERSYRGDEFGVARRGASPSLSFNGSNADAVTPISALRIAGSPGTPSAYVPRDGCTSPTRSPIIGSNFMLAARSPVLSSPASFRRGRRAPVPAVHIHIPTVLPRNELGAIKNGEGEHGNGKVGISGASVASPSNLRTTWNATPNNMPTALPSEKSPQHASSPSLMRPGLMPLPTAPAIISSSKPKMFGPSFDPQSFDSPVPRLTPLPQARRRQRGGVSTNTVTGRLALLGQSTVHGAPLEREKASSLLGQQSDHAAGSPSPGVASGRLSALSGMGGSMRGRSIGEAAAGRGRLAAASGVRQEAFSLQIAVSVPGLEQRTRIRRGGGARGVGAGSLATGMSSPGGVSGVLALARAESEMVSSPSPAEEAASLRKLQAYAPHVQAPRKTPAASLPTQTPISIGTGSTSTVGRGLGAMANSSHIGARVPLTSNLSRNAESRNAESGQRSVGYGNVLSAGTRTNHQNRAALRGESDSGFGLGPAGGGRHLMGSRLAAESRVGARLPATLMSRPGPRSELAMLGSSTLQGD